MPHRAREKYITGKRRQLYSLLIGQILMSGAHIIKTHRVIIAVIIMESRSELLQRNC